MTARRQLPTLLFFYHCASLALAAFLGTRYKFSMLDKKCTGDLDWEDVRYFAALARHRSLSATARALRVNHATVSRRVAHLEALLGRALFERRAEELRTDGRWQSRAGRSERHGRCRALGSATPRCRRGAQRPRATDCRTQLGRRISGRPAGRAASTSSGDRSRTHRRGQAPEPRSKGSRHRFAFRSPSRAASFAGRRVGTIYFGLYVAAAGLHAEPDASARLPLIGFDREGDC